MPTARTLFYTLFPFASFLVFAYPIWRLSDWYLLAGNPVSLTQVLLLWFVGTVGMWYSFSGPKMLVRYFMVHWMGVGFVLFALTLFAEPVVYIVPSQSRLIALFIVLLALALVIWAIIASHLLRVKRLTIESSKIQKELSVVQISDIHIGSRRGSFLDRIVTSINKLSPDITVITGDLIDSSAVSSEQLNALTRLAMPVYFCIGNHERYADLDKILNILKTYGVKTLSQKAIVEQGVQIVGIDDADRRNQVELTLPNIPLKSNIFTILLYHRPVGWMAARQGEVDLMLSGHTHGGQIVPFNWLVKQQFDRLKGLFEQGGKWLYVSCGTGTWGPLMRLGTSNEITQFTLKPKS